MHLLDRIRIFLGSDIWFLLGFVRDIPVLIFFWFVDREEFTEIKNAIVDELTEYFSSFS